MPAVEPPPALDLFDGVARGDVAPDWVRSGIVHAWGIEPAAVVTLIVLSENVTFRVELGGVALMVVRLGRPGYAAGPDHIRSELVWVEALRRDAAIPTPEPRRGVDGDFVQFLHDEAGALWSAVAFDYVTGHMLEDEPVARVAARYGEIGRLTALLHAHARNWRPSGSFARFSWDVPDMVGTAARWGDWRGAALSATQTRTLERAEAAARATLDELRIDRSPVHFGLIHGDLRPSNVMVTEDVSDPLTIIDFDDCGYGYYLYDFAAAITFYEHRPEALRMASSWIEGYRQLMPLSSADLRGAGAFSMLRRLTMLGWATTHRSDALPPALWEENLPGTVEVAERFLVDRSWLTRG
ncbi:phosphotransferase [Microbacterium sp. BG28]|uniref:phosphotransferase enzyme family protein n=1 Tax=Microbacterium sp. BG28 TaxID=3097356 RepID=UPI002A5A98AD|nr:phosphotransferase [Microbacterium sp. BG28]MDY0828267.1 phosphotransferase [Microbacterium sp. BG28]